MRSAWFPYQVTYISRDPMCAKYVPIPIDRLPRLPSSITHLNYPSRASPEPEPARAWHPTTSSPSFPSSAPSLVVDSLLLRSAVCLSCDATLTSSSGLVDFTVSRLIAHLALPSSLPFAKRLSEITRLHAFATTSQDQDQREPGHPGLPPAEAAFSFTPLSLCPAVLRPRTSVVVAVARPPAKTSSVPRCSLHAYVLLSPSLLPVAPACRSGTDRRTFQPLPRTYLRRTYHKLIAY